MKRQFLLFSILCFILSTNPIKSVAKIGLLVDCKDSPAFTKRLNSSVKKLENRLNKYELNSPPALALKNQIEQTKSRFDSYSKSNLLCGVDGLPHLIVNGDINHASEFLLPGLVFIYITGWIGWAGRKYLEIISQTKNSTEKEIIIDVPLALSIMATSYLWPANAWSSFSSGNFVAKSEDITISPR